MGSHDHTSYNPHHQRGELRQAIHRGQCQSLQTGTPFGRNPLRVLIRAACRGWKISGITVGGWKLDADGILSILDTPGLRVQLDPGAVALYCRNGYRADE